MEQISRASLEGGRNGVRTAGGDRFTWQREDILLPEAQAGDTAPIKRLKVEMMWLEPRKGDNDAIRRAYWRNRGKKINHTQKTKSRGSQK